MAKFIPVQWFTAQKVSKLKGNEMKYSLQCSHH